jgi:hypothetical protein
VTEPPVITLDVDWAPDFMIDEVAQALAARGVRATWFITHPSPAVDRLRERPDLFELGIHPNLLPGTTQGPDPIAHCLELVPGARCARTHSLVQSTPLLEDLMAAGIAVDVSLFLPRHEHLRPFEHFSAAGRIVRVPYVFEDDLEMARPEPCWDPEPLLAGPGLKVFDFHPVHLCLNSSSFAPYAALKPRLRELTRVDRAPGPGARTLFDALLERGEGARVSDLVPG